MNIIPQKSQLLPKKPIDVSLVVSKQEIEQHKPNMPFFSNGKTKEQDKSKNLSTQKHIFMAQM